MKPIILITCMLVILSSCHVQDEISDGYKQMSHKELRQEFKDIVLCECVTQGMNDKDLATRMRMNDKSYYSAVGFALKDKISSLLIPVFNQIKIDSAASMETVAEGGAGRKVFDHCIAFYRNKKLDSAARAETKKWYKSNIDSLVHVTSPSY